MPAKKKTAAKKTVAKKAAKKAVTKKTAAKKAAPKKTAAKKTAKAGSNGKKLPKASELLNRTKHHTPAIFKVGTRKAAPVVFSLEDVREILKKRAKEETKEAPAKKKAVKKAAAKKAPAPDLDAPQEKSTHAAASLADILGFGGAVAGTPAPQRSVPRKWKKYFNSLIELRDHVRQSLGMHAEDTLKRSQKEDSGDLSTSSDAGTDTFDRDFALSVVSSEQEALKEIEDAIERIYNGSYAVCEITGEAISPERLEAVPFTRFSLEGQRQHELTARRRTSRGGTFLSEGAEGISFGDDNDDN